jgi:Tol biopolymer transport system component
MPKGHDGPPDLFDRLDPPAIDTSAPEGFTRLTSSEAREEYPSWSPDGETLLYEVADAEGSYQLWTMPSGGGEPNRITDHAAAGWATWHPDGDRIAYWAADQEGRGNLWLYDLASAERRRLTEHDMTAWPQWSPDGERLAYQAMDDDEWTLRLLDPSSGRSRDLFRPADVLPSRPLWSPDGSQTLMVTDELFDQGTESDPASQQWQPRLYRGDALGQSPVDLGAGMAPFWLDNGRYGYLRLNDQQERELVVATAGDDEETVWIDPSKLLATVPSAERPDALFILFAQAKPDDADVISVLATATPNQNRDAYLFLLQREAGQSEPRDVSLVWHSDQGIGSTFSPDGRWLTIYEYGDDGPDQAIRLFDTTSGEMMVLSAGRFSPVEWTADGRWLVRSVSDQALLLTAPAYDYHRLIPYDFGGCGRLLSGLFWTDDE